MSTCVAPEYVSHTDRTIVEANSDVVGPLAQPVDTATLVPAEEFAESKSVFPFALIVGGIAIYLIAIAAFASFLGVAVGVATMTVGGVAYVCRGLGRQNTLHPAMPVAPGYFEDAAVAFTGPFDVADNGNPPESQAQETLVIFPERETVSV